MKVEEIYVVLTERNTCLLFTDRGEAERHGTVLEHEPILLEM